MNCHGVLLNMSVNKLYFVLRQCDHPGALTAVSTVKDVLELNLFPGY